MAGGGPDHADTEASAIHADCGASTVGVRARDCERGRPGPDNGKRVASVFDQSGEGGVHRLVQRQRRIDVERIVDGSSPGEVVQSQVVAVQVESA